MRATWLAECDRMLLLGEIIVIACALAPETRELLDTYR
jgi:hypothetical protein